MTKNPQRDVRSNLKTFLGSLLLKLFYGLNRRIVKGRKNYLELTKNGESVNMRYAEKFHAFDLS